MFWYLWIHQIWILIFAFASAEDSLLFADPDDRGFCRQVNRQLPTKFYLRTRENFDLSSAMARQRGKIFESHLEPDKDVVVTIHEYLRGCDKPFTMGVTKAYHKARPEVQIVNVCWSAGFPNLEREIGRSSALMRYPKVTKFVPCVGNVIAKFLKRIHRESHIPWSRITLIGHSLGCQLSGDVGNKLGGKLWKIIACDPATPFFGVTRLTSSLLSPKSAENVIALHTSRGQYNMGTADFYANSIDQPGCKKYKNNWIEYWTCNHGRSYEIFIKTILQPDAFPARKCVKKGSKLNNKKLCEKRYSTYFGPDTEVTGLYFFKT